MGFMYIIYLEIIGALYGKLTSMGIYNETRKDPMYPDFESDKLIRIEKLLAVKTRISTSVWSRHSTWRWRC